MRRNVTQDELLFIKSLLLKTGYHSVVSRLSEETLMINGATVYELSDRPEGRVFTYIEDDLDDEAGYPYLFECLYEDRFGWIENGRRLVALYFDGEHLLVPASGDLYLLYGTSTENELVIDKGRSIKLPTPLMLNVPKGGARRMTATERESVDKALGNYGKFTGSIVIGDIDLVLLWIIVIGLIYIFDGIIRLFHCRRILWCDGSSTGYSYLRKCIFCSLV